MTDKKEYIERGALEDKLNERLKYLREQYGDYDHYTDGFDEVVGIVEDEPAAAIVFVARERTATTMRLIDADALAMEIVNTVSEASCKAWETGTHTYIDTLNRLAERQHEIIDMIHDAPTINPEDLRPHGWWESDGGDVLFHCSECGTQISTSWDYEDLHWNYCPNCGAKMDGKEHCK